MNTKQFSVLFFAAMIGAGMAIFNPIINGIAIQLPLLSAAAGTLSLPLAVLGVLKLAAAASLAGVGVASLFGGGGGDEEVVEVGGYGHSAGGYGYGYRHKRSAGGLRPLIGNEEAVFGLVSSMDMFSCGKALICALQTRDYNSLAADEQLMLTLFA